MQCRPTGIPDLQNLNPLPILGRAQAPLDERGTVIRRGPTAPAEELCCQLRAAGPDRPYRRYLDFGIYVPVAPAEMSSVRELRAAYYACPEIPAEACRAGGLCIQPGTRCGHRKGRGNSPVRQPATARVG